jgi:hypothetical protein
MKVKEQRNNHRMFSSVTVGFKELWIRCVILVINVSYFKMFQANYWYSCKRLLFIHISRNQMFLHYISVSSDFVVKCVKCVKDTVFVYIQLSQNKHTLIWLFFAFMDIMCSLSHLGAEHMICRQSRISFLFTFELSPHVPLKCI